MKPKHKTDPHAIQAAINERERSLEHIDITPEEIAVCKGLPIELKNFYKSGNRGGAKAFVKHYRDFIVKYNQPI